MEKRILPGWAGVIFWNDGPELLGKSLKALKGNGFKIIAIDGIFQEMLKVDPALPIASVDGCMELARNLADVFVPSPAEGWIDQPTKRNVYMKAVKPGEYVWAIDADEIMRPFQLGTPLEKDVYRINEHRLYEDGVENVFSTIRTYKIYPDLRYKYQHCRIYRLDQHKPELVDSGLITKAKGGKNQTYPMIMDAIGTPVIIDHYRKWRPKERFELKKKYYEIRGEKKYGY